MFQNQNSNKKRLVQDAERKEDEVSFDKLFDQEQLNDEDLVNVAGGTVKDLSHHTLTPEKDPAKPTPTFPTPLYLEVLP